MEKFVLILIILEVLYECAIERYCFIVLVVLILIILEVLYEIPQFVKDAASVLILIILEVLYEAAIKRQYRVS